MVSSRVLDVRDLQRAHGLDGGRQRRIRRTGASAARQLSPGFSQRSKDLGPVESLPRTMLAKTHGPPASSEGCLANISVSPCSHQAACHTFSPRCPLTSSPALEPVNIMESLSRLVVAAQAGNVEAYGVLVQSTQTMAHAVAVGRCVIRCGTGCGPASLPAGVPPAFGSAGAGGVSWWLRRDRDHRRAQHATSEASDAAAAGRHPRRAGARRGGDAMVGPAAPSARVGVTHADTRGASIVRPALSRRWSVARLARTPVWTTPRCATPPARQGQVTQGD